MKGSFLKHKRKDGQKVMLKGEILNIKQQLNISWVYLQARNTAP